MTSKLMLLVALVAAFVVVLAAGQSADKSARYADYREYHQWKKANQVDFGETGSVKDLDEFSIFEEAKLIQREAAAGPAYSATVEGDMYEERQGLGCVPSFSTLFPPPNATALYGLYGGLCPLTTMSRRAGGGYIGSGGSTLDWPASWSTFSLTGSSGVWDQGTCPSCWAYVVSTAVEYGLTAKGLTIPSGGLSWAQIFQCSSTSGNDHSCGRNATGTPQYACNYLKGAPKGISKGLLAAANDWKVGDSCTVTANVVNSWNPSAYYVSGYYLVGLWSAQTEASMYTVAQSSVIITHIDSHGDGNFAALTSGLFSSDSCSKMYLDHSLLIIGVSSESCGNPAVAFPAWLVQNSWGRMWGVDGFGKIRAGRNTCGIATYGIVLTYGGGGGANYA